MTETKNHAAHAPCRNENNTPGYALPRDLAETSRLNKQHFLILRYQDTPLEPHIPLGQANSILDVGTGTGIWLEELAKEVSADTQLDGIDPSSKQFPKHTAPNIHLSEAPALPTKELPAFLRKQYEIVHLRLLTCGLTEQDYPGVLDNIFDILTPGGWMQWVELIVTGKGSGNESFNKWARLTNAAPRVLGRSIDSAQKIPDVLHSSSFENVKVRRFNFHFGTSLEKDQVALEEFAENVATVTTPLLVALAESGTTDEIKTTDEVDDLVHAAYEEMRVLNMDQNRSSALDADDEENGMEMSVTLDVDVEVLKKELIVGESALVELN
ncbi:hypothetical protein SAICODRAFT_10248 [Saitoella complicata NRRL Y-17804]|uniref:uncharacterized protein n=1 Tax=Saitoella complicata (strain BCRC 22490 / CBS 7301 / JCM 7358 / NBRC 10748 / NRRL Y-17804) TaxID=698492 RepID=UPI0008671FFB|nr:uncharacterized protein SAICODRAFT_10248 [Saitoella complicata NRRL Y-17804]ODQ50198.1 hypothetical protein SAICODRAFT_10248 [Saitoella complicata NRRL Y-17804]